VVADFGKVDLPECEANARLMVSAPDMLAELKEVLPLLDMAFSFEGDVFRKQHNHATDVYSRIEALIAKAARA
jgi:hypothetical protein